MPQRAHAPRNSELAQYLREIREIPLLTPEEERELVVRLARDGCEAARERLVCGNLRLAVYLANRYAGLGVPLQDLVEAANVGLLLAVERFDGGKGVRFATYAQWWIRRSIFTALSENGCMIHLPQDARRARRLCREAVERLNARLGRPASEEEVSAATGMSMDVIRGYPVTLRMVGGGEDEGHAPGDVADVRTEPVEHRVAQREQQERVRLALPSLPLAEAEVIRRHFGLEGSESQTVREIASDLDLPERQVRHLLRGALARLAVMLGAREEAPALAG
ncbi:MAG: sigma-70 family RNA polymerase sigma factor [Phycisphaerales bacterium]